ncbi:hypothetical protein [Clostridiisalibacter paucivorans]|uniref:hypothetical protein n=1 Tax=Clostridiisalibacter paucivorans TaxID=408753 RepID=UPI00047CFC42|nr:hypothetical protein [Clostridiisalibacter paucivorans]
METIIHGISQKIINETKENLINTLANHKNISEFILNTEKILDDIGVQIVQKALETVDYLVKLDNLRKEKWTVQRKADKKTIATILM